MNPSYIANNIEELLKQSPPAVKELLSHGEVDRVANELGTKYNILPGEYIGLSNIVVFTLIKALDPSNIQKALMEIVGMPENVASSIATDIQEGIYKKVPIQAKEPAQENSNR